MLDAIRRNRIEAVLAIVAIVALYYGAQSMLAWQDARAAYEDARETQQELEQEASTYNLNTLIARRDRLEEASSASAFPTREEVEQHIGRIAVLLDDPLVSLGPVVIGEIVEDVPGEDGGDARTYEGVEMDLTLNGDVADLLSLAERLLAAVPVATFQDMNVTLDGSGGDSSLELRVVLFHQ